MLCMVEITMSYSYEETPEGNAWFLHPLFSVCQKGKLRVWQIGFDESESSLVTKTGILCHTEDIGDHPLLNDIVRSENPIQELEQVLPIVSKAYSKLRETRCEVTPKAKRTLFDQGLQEARSRYKKKLGETCTPDLDSLLDGSASIGFKPQLAIPYFFPGDPDHKESLLTPQQIKTGVQCQIKHNGERCVSYIADDDSVMTITRKNEVFDFLERQRVQMSLLLSYLPVGSYLDGELVHPGGFEMTHSVLSNTERHEEMDAVIYNVFDVVLPNKEATLETRTAKLNKAYKKYLVDSQYEEGVLNLVESHLFHSIDEIRSFYDEAIANKEEGIIIRKLAGGDQHKNSIYRHGKNNNLLKVKPVDDAEATIVEVQEGKGAQKGCAIFTLEMENGIRFKCASHGTLPKRREHYAKREKYIGKMYKFQYKYMTNKGKPGHATGIAFL